MNSDKYQNRGPADSAVDTDAVARQSILLAEDDQEMRAMLKRILTDRGYDVETCADGFELFQHFGSFSQADLPPQFDLVISDIRMPGFTGMEILDYVHDTGGFPPMMLITAFGDQRTHRDAEDLGVAAILDKPFDIDYFMEVVEDILDKKKAGMLKLWSKTDSNADLSLGFPLEVVFHNYPELDDIRKIVREGAEPLKAFKVKIVFCRVIISELQHIYENEYFSVKIILTVPGKVFLVQNSPHSQDKRSDLNSTIRELFEILHGRLNNYIDSIRNGTEN